jgi:hypothetical protein
MRADEEAQAPPPGRRGLFRALVRPRGRLRVRPLFRRGGGSSIRGDSAGLASLSAAAAADALAGPPPPAAAAAAQQQPSPLDTALAALDGVAASVTSALAAALPPWLRGETGPHADAGLSAADAAWRETRCFPSRIAPPPSGSGKGEVGGSSGPAPPRGPATHRLAAVGTRAFTLWGASLRIYDFAVYVAPDAAAASPALVANASPSSCSAAAPGGGGDDPALAFSRALRSADDVPKTLVVRTRRALPLPLMKAEYARILSRRITAVGGSPDDAALAEVIGLFRADVLPPSARGPAGMVRAGTVLEFGRAPGGRLSIALDGHPVGEVESRALSSAVLDIYLGLDLPACPAAARAGCERVRGWVKDSQRARTGGGSGRGGRDGGPGSPDDDDRGPGPLGPELVCGRAVPCPAALG